MSTSLAVFVNNSFGTTHNITSDDTLTLALYSYAEKKNLNDDAINNNNPNI